MNTSGKKTILVLTVIFFIFNAAVLLAGSSMDPGAAGGLALLFGLPIFAIDIFLFVYFTILALRYTREKSAIHQLDKIEFFILLAYFILVLGLPTLHNLGIRF